MEACLQLLTAQGYLNACSCITLPNAASEALHRRFGFVRWGVFPRTGYKLGAWHDVLWMGKALGDFAGAPGEVRRLSALEE